MAKAPAKKKTATKKVVTKAKTKARASAPKAQPKVTQKNAFEQNYGEGTAFDLDYGKLVIIALLLYVAFQVS